jgi:hypothetical protein
MSPGWDYQPGEIAQFSNSDEFKVVCVGLLHNNNLQKLPMYIFIYPDKSSRTLSAS